ncbi:MAG: NAD(P)H-dependent oxidoreductase [Pseudomonadales bacterium]
MKRNNLLVIESSGRKIGSITRETSDFLVNKLKELNDYEVRFRDLEITDLPLIDNKLIGAMFSPAESLSGEQKELLKLSEELIAELEWADEILIASPIYNFSVPARLKAWIDQVCRAGITFKYTENGPVGLLKVKKAYLVVASGGTPIGSEIDFASGYLQHIMKFIGVSETHLVRADGSKNDPKEILQRTHEQINQLLAA